MNRSVYYDNLKTLAREVRQQFQLTTPRITLSDMRRIYKAEGVTIDYWPHKLKNLRGAYFDDELGPSVLIDKRLPNDPRIFTLGHELKHHLVDRGSGLSHCSANNEKEPIEIGAEVFAAELLFPDQVFIALLAEMGITTGMCTPEIIVRLKHETQTTLSYAGLAKKAEYLQLAAHTSVTRIKDWRRRETDMYGEPLYMQIQRAKRTSV